MKIKFRQSSEQNIQILDADDNHLIGRIFTPGGTHGEKENAIQICGFDTFAEFWGCGVFGDKNNKNAKKDIQLLFEPNSHPARIDVDLGEETCMRCFHPHKDCKCLEMVKQLRDAAEEIEKHYIEKGKELIVESLEGKRDKRYSIYKIN